jgi:hypothetical protein
MDKFDEVLENRRLYKMRMNEATHAVLKKYKVNYKDPNNFIYKIDNLDIKDFEKNYIKIYKQYMKYYENYEIDCENLGITSFPTYPKLKNLYCSNNANISIENQPSLEKLDCSNCFIEKLPEMPNLIYLDCNRNYIEHLGDYKNLQVLNCADNYIKKIPIYDDLRWIDISGNFVKLDGYENKKLEHVSMNIFNYLNIKNLKTVYIDDYEYIGSTFYSEETETF